MNDLPESITSITNNGLSELEALNYMRGVESSTCLLLPTTPSPTPQDFKHPLSEEATEFEAPFIASDGPNIHIMQNSDASAGDSSSSADSNSVVHDPVSAQLINNISMLDYQTLSKNGDRIMGETEDCKLNGSLTLGNRKLPNFINWNWPVIRKVLLWVVLTGLVACLGTIIAMVVTLPKHCNPDLPWHQGKVFYEVFPASFKDSDNDGTGDLRGLINELDYIQGIGASVIRLNYIFKAHNYPDQYNNVTSLLEIERSVGSIQDFQCLVAAVHDRDMSLVIDLPVLSMAAPNTSSNSSRATLIANGTLISYSDQTTAAIKYWARAHNVDGFYLKGLEDYIDDINFEKSLHIWKAIIGTGKILIASENVYKNTKKNLINVLLSKLDLIDVHLDLGDSISNLKDRINNMVDGTLWAEPHYPWVHWNIGNIGSKRLSSKHNNNALALTCLELTLPGTISLFYGDEIGLGTSAAHDVEKDFSEHEHTNHLVQMVFAKNYNSKTIKLILPWNSKSDTKPKFHYLNVIRIFTELRKNTPTIYLRAINKDGNLLKNMAIRNTEDNLIVMERWYPRRNTCVFVGNFGNTAVTTDLSTMFYGGTVVAATNTSLIGQVMYLDHVTFLPYSALILKLEK